MSLMHQNVILVHLGQGLLGAVSLKPTAFRCVLIVELEMIFKKQRDNKLRQLDPLVGRDGKHFKTFYAKEYPPRLCELLAAAMLHPLLFDKVTPTTTVNHIGDHHRGSFEQFNVPITVDTQIGPDYSCASLVSSPLPS